MNRTDLTLPENFTQSLGSFWSDIFNDGLFASAIGDYSSHQLAQIYKDLVVAVNSCSINTVPVYRRETVYPLVVSKADIDDNMSTPVYGGGLTYGSQGQSSPSIGEVVLFGKPYKDKDSYFVELPDGFNLSSNSVIAMERLYGASILWVNGVDFVIKDNRIVFKKNPFSLSAFPTRAVRKDGVDDLETVLWLCEVDFDKNDIFRNFGSIFSNVKTSSEEYKSVCKSFLSLLSTGASIDRMDSLFSSAAGAPIIKEDNETVLSVIDSAQGKFVETDKNLYYIPTKQIIKSSVYVGVTLPSGFALTSTVDVIDPKKRPDWWKDLVAIPAAGVFASDDIQLLSFPNKESDVTFTTDGNSTFARFEIIGDQKSKDEFWKRLDGEVAAQGLDMSALMGNHINPAEFFTKNMAKSIILPIIIDISQVDNVPFLFSSISSSINQLRGVLPVYAFVYVFLSIEQSDEYNLGGDEITGEGAFAQDQFTGWNISPAIQTDTMNCGEKEFATEAVLVKYRSKCSL